MAKKLTDSKNVIALSNFDSYEGKDHLVLKFGIFGSKKEKLSTIKEKIISVLISSGWKEDEDKGIYTKEATSIKMHNVKKVFRAGAYQNRETPMLGVEISGPKKSAIID